MAVRNLKAWAAATMIVTAGLLLFGCAGNRQTVSIPLERSDFTGTGAGNAGENKDTAAGPPQTAGLRPQDTPETLEEKQKEDAKDSGIPPVSSPPPDGASREQTQPRYDTAAVPGAENKEPETRQENSREANPVETPAAGRIPAAPVQNKPAKAEENRPAEIKFSEMYSGSSSRGLKFSDKLTGLNGKKVVMTGYMAPPLKPSFTFFVLTREPMSICPFCSSDASWPEDIVLTYLPKGKELTPGNSVFRVTGTLELGSHTDPDTGFVSQVRIHADKIETIR